jgi:hypothetical protein
MSPSELYLIHFQNPEPKFYARIPHIFDHLTYDELNKKTGKVERKRLSVNAIQLYRVLKAVAGDLGKCWKNTKNLAEQANLSVGAISNAKEELQKKFIELDLNPLIQITKKNKSRSSMGGTSYHEIKIMDIWKWNNAFMGTFKFHKGGSSSPHELEESSGSPHEPEPLGSGSPHEPNNNPINKKQLSKEQQPAPLAPVVSSAKKERLFPSERSKKIYDQLVNAGCHEVTAYKISVTCPPDDFNQAISYTNRMCKKSTKENKWGYLQSVIKNKWWQEKLKNE